VLSTASGIQAGRARVLMRVASLRSRAPRLTIANLRMGVSETENPMSDPATGFVLRRRGVTWLLLLWRGQ